MARPRVSEILRSWWALAIAVVFALQCTPMIDGGGDGDDFDLQDGIDFDICNAGEPGNGRAGPHRGKGAGAPSGTGRGSRRG